MRQSNLYVIGFTAAVTVVLGGILAFASESLGPRQKKQVELDTKKKILNTVVNISSEMTEDQILGIYSDRVKSIVLDASGAIADTDIPADEIDIAREFKKSPEDRLLPVFALKDEVNPSEYEAYIVCVYGNGLWNSIWGYIAIDSDMNTIRGAIFDHAGETPGLGARITERKVQERFLGKKIFSDDFSKMESIKVLKGEGRAESALNEHQVDGLSGSTMTTQGVNKMLEQYFGLYEPFFNTAREKGVDNYFGDTGVQ